MCTVLLPPGDKPVAVNKYISYHIIGIPLLHVYAFVSWTGKNLLTRLTGKETEILSEFLGFRG
jgi:hypothetical protein